MKRIIGIIFLLALSTYGYAAPDEKPAAKPIAELNLWHILKSKFSTSRDGDKGLIIDDESGRRVLKSTDDRRKQVIFTCPWVAKHPIPANLRMEQIGLWNRDNKKFQVVYDSVSKIFMLQWRVPFQQAMTSEEAVAQMEDFFLAVNSFYKQFHESGLLE